MSAFRRRDRMAVLPLAVLAISIVGCESSAVPTAETDRATAPEALQSQGHGVGSLVPFVTIGVSIEEGRQSNGTVHTSQVQAWPAQMARNPWHPVLPAADRRPGMSRAGRRTTDLRARSRDADDCAPNLPGVHLPANDLGVTNASTNDALFTTPEIAATFSEFRGERYSRILPPGQTQVTAMVTEHPRLVAVDPRRSRSTGADIRKPGGCHTVRRLAEGLRRGDREGEGNRRQGRAGLVQQRCRAVVWRAERLGALGGSRGVRGAALRGSPGMQYDRTGQPRQHRRFPVPARRCAGEPGRSSRAELHQHSRTPRKMSSPRPSSRSSGRTRFAGNPISNNWPGATATPSSASTTHCIAVRASSLGSRLRRSCIHRSPTGRS